MKVEQIFNKYYVYGETDRGKCRELNEDNILINSNAALAMVADGMGGHQYGDRASTETIHLINRLVEQYLPLDGGQPQNTLLSRLSRFFTRPAATEFGSQIQILNDILVEANRALYRINREEEFEDGNGMGTTVVGCRLMAYPDKLLVFHVGDSRMYRIRDNRLAPLTKDHSVYQLWLDGGQIGNKPGSNVILQGIGPKADIHPEIQLIDIMPGDAFLLCSDGLNDMLDDAEIETVVSGLAPGNLAEKVRQLIDTANANGGADNVSVIIICQ